MPERIHVQTETREERLARLRRAEDFYRESADIFARGSDYEDAIANLERARRMRDQRRVVEREIQAERDAAVLAQLEGRDGSPC